MQVIVRWRGLRGADAVTDLPGGVTMLSQFMQFFLKLTPLVRVAYGGIAALLVLLVAGVGYWSSQTQFAVLATQLAPEDAAAIVKKLEADQTKYKLSGDGTSIMVPSDRVQNIRMNLVASGLPQGSGKGYELFDTMSLGTTPFVQNLNYVRAIEGELARTIKQLQPVAEARVHIVQPEPTPFVREEKPVTASIVVKTKPGASLSRASVASIVAITANGVKGLTAEHVTVVDTEGRILSEKRDPRGMASNDQLAYQRDVEAHLAENAQEILTRLLGPGRAVVRVTAEMSFRHLKETSEKYDPDGKVLIREQTMQSKSSMNGGAKGPTGAVSNIPPAPGNGAASGAGPSKNDETTESEFAVSKVNKSQEEQQGAIDRLTVAVMLIPAPSVGDTPEESLGITPDEAKALVKQSVGFKEGRDQIQVSIGKSPAEASDATAASNVVALAPVGTGHGRDFVSLLRNSALGLAALIAAAIAVVAMRRRKAAPALQPAMAAASADPSMDELTDLHAIAMTIKAWLEEPDVIRFAPNPASSMPEPQAKPA